MNPFKILNKIPHSKKAQRYKDVFAYEEMEQRILFSAESVGSIDIQTVEPDTDTVISESEDISGTTEQNSADSSDGQDISTDSDVTATVESATTDEQEAGTSAETTTSVSIETTDDNDSAEETASAAVSETNSAETETTTDDSLKSDTTLTSSEASATETSTDTDILTNESDLETSLLDNNLDETDILSAEDSSAESSTEATEISQEIVFVDDSVYEYEQIYDDLNAETDETRQITTIVIDSDSDGIQQITDYLATCSDIDAVHIISHGSDASLSVGSSLVDYDDLEQYSDAISSWKNALSEDADILLYGCNIAADADGQAFVDKLSQLSGADVAASSDTTGASDLGGDWDLEYVTGSIETATAVTSEIQDTWEATLTTWEVKNTNDSGADSLRDIISRANSGDKIIFSLSSGDDHIISLSSIINIYNE